MSVQAGPNPRGKACVTDDLAYLWESTTLGRPMVQRLEAACCDAGVSLTKVAEAITKLGQHHDLEEVVRAVTYLLEEAQTLFQESWPSARSIADLMELTPPPSPRPLPQNEHRLRSMRRSTGKPWERRR